MKYRVAVKKMSRKFRRLSGRAERRTLHFASGREDPAGGHLSGWERRREEGQQREACLTFVGDTQLLVTSVGGERACCEGHAAVPRLQHPLAFDGVDHQLRRSVGVWGEGLAGAKPNHPDIGLCAFEERLGHHSLAVVGGGVGESDDVHHDSIARCQLGVSSRLGRRVEQRAMTALLWLLRRYSLTAW